MSRLNPARRAAKRRFDAQQRIADTKNIEHDRFALRSSVGRLPSDNLKPRVQWGFDGRGKWRKGRNVT